MKLVLRCIAALAALVSLAPANAAPPVKDWSQVAVRTPSGSFLQGNPNAPVKLIEYLSFTCPHCAVFESTAGPLVPKYIKPGLVSYEVRVAIRDGFDMLATTLARCAGPRAFFAVKPALYAAQGDWEQKANDWVATSPDLSKLSEAEAGKAAAKGAGLDVFFARHGLAPARADACLSNTAEQKLIGQRGQEIWNMPGFPGTPAFAINGAMTPPIGAWSDLDKALAAALAKSGHPKG
ncbi:protein-disulfide isomerase [Sphingomonas vulcanisoli]|uniref:Protein-disulfide isomerase n=1 Tax=Sphingomonas vulcanisoli TaxID=1658060 RepID=A0ABX0TV85_9SPHN|nr:thioredoxin domain-containing protein [Sphingomonas vulcanisoli]NIJ08265.1 protein-disulfide isomerase [Sphingomonas vulcanisoli]